MKHSISFFEFTVDQISHVESLIQKNHGLLSEYVSQLRWWNKKVNLVSRDVSHETLMEHVAHSLLISQVEVFQESDSILDTGSGGGLPGVPLAVCFPEKQFLLNDIVAKKMMTVKQIGVKLKLSNMKTRTDSVANIQITKNQLVVSKHAFKVYGLIDLLKGSEWRNILFLKGEEEAQQEIEKVEEPVSASIINLDSVLSSEFYRGKAIVHIHRINE